MKIYYSASDVISKGEEEKLFKKLISPFSIGILVSFYGSKMYDPIYCDKIFLDSGAFSAWKQNIEINIQEYIEFLHKEMKKYDVYVALDVIGDPVKTWDNYIIMKEAGVDPLPVFHFGEPLDYLYKYMDETDYIGLGGAAGISKKSSRLNWFDKLFGLFPDRSKAKFHGFGIMDEDLIKRYPWESIDATSAAVLARYGGIYTPWGTYCVSQRTVYKSTSWKTDISENAVKKFVHDYKVPYDKLVQGDEEGRLYRLAVNVLYYENIAKECPDRFTKKGQTFLNLGDFNK